MTNQELLNIYDSTEESTILLEFSISKKDVEGKVTAMSYNLVKHLLKLVIFGSSCSCYNHWLQEVHTKLTDYSSFRLKPDNKSIKIKDLRLWAESWFDERCFINYIDSIILLENEFEHINYDIMKTNYNEFLELYDSLLVSCSENKYSKNFLDEKIKEFLNTL